jgi:hypothetical protein
MGTDSQGPARPLNAVVHRFDGHNDRIPHEVIALEAAGAIRVRLHVAFEDVVSFPDAETIVPWNFYAGPFDFDAPSAPPELIEALEPELHRFLIHHARVRLDETHESFFLQAESIYSDVNLFYRLAAYFHAKLVEYAVEVVLFDEVPHYGFGYLLYLTARAMGIRTIMFLQNVHLERSLVLERIEEMGHLIDRPILSEALSTPIEPGFDQAVYVSTDRTRDRYAEHMAHMELRQLRSPAVKALPRLWLSMLVRRWASQLLGHRYVPRGRPMSHLLREHLMGPEVRKLQTWYASEGRRRFTTRDVDLSADYVLFALHMQPEVTTVPLGGEYFDQARAIERLRHMLPSSWKIYVKEHPCSFGCWRDPHFHMRLRSIPGVEIVAAELETHPLLSRCRFAATLTGSVGWEAITGGKPILVFGHAWYNGLPGVFHIRDKPHFEQIAACEIDHEELVLRFRELSMRLGDFALLWGLRPELFPEGFDRDENTHRFVACVERLLAMAPS